MTGIEKGHIFINNAGTVIGENHGVINIGSHPKHEKIWDVSEECVTETPSSKNKAKTEENPAAPKDEVFGKVAKEVNFIATELRQRKKRMSVANRKKNQGMKGGDTKDGRDNKEVMRLIKSKDKDGASLSEICFNICKMQNLKVKPASLERSYRRWLNGE